MPRCGPLGGAGAPNIFGRVGPFIGESRKMRKLLLIAFDVCFWTALIAAIVTTVARLGAHAKGLREKATAPTSAKSA